MSNQPTTPGPAASLAGVVMNLERLAALRATGLVDSAAEPSFDRLTRLAARLTGAPVTFISLVDDQRDFYKSCFGFPEPLATTREITGTTFCHYALSSDGPLVINDALADPVYRLVPTVESLGVRAYLGVPLTLASGQTIGSFCAIDFTPRVWSELDIEVMTELASSTLREIELRTALTEITHDQARLSELVQSNEHLYREAERAGLEKERFFAAVTHELRTPMTSILGWVRILREEVPDNPDAAEAVAMIEGSARAQARLVDDLLDASRIVDGKISLQRSMIDLNEVLASATGAALPAATTNGLRLTLKAVRLPPVHADAGRIRQVLDNLISNAIKFTPKGGAIEVEAENHPSSLVRITVRDTGRGIAPELLPHVFDRGWQENSAEHGGLGLGLTIADHLLRIHGGSLTAQSAGTGMGAAFTLTLPLQSD